MPTPRHPRPVVSRQPSKPKWQPRYLQSAMSIFTPVAPWKGPLNGVYHCVPANEITAEEVTGRKGGP